MEVCSRSWIPSPIYKTWKKRKPVILQKGQLNQYFSELLNQRYRRVRELGDAATPEQIAKIDRNIVEQFDEVSQRFFKLYVLIIDSINLARPRTTIKFLLRRNSNVQCDQRLQRDQSTNWDYQVHSDFGRCLHNFKLITSCTVISLSLNLPVCISGPLNLRPNLLFELINKYISFNLLPSNK